MRGCVCSWDPYDHGYLIKPLALYKSVWLHVGITRHQPWVPRVSGAQCKTASSKALLPLVQLSECQKLRREDLKSTFAGQLSKNENMIFFKGKTKQKIKEKTETYKEKEKKRPPRVSSRDGSKFFLDQKCYKKPCSN